MAAPATMPRQALDLAKPAATAEGLRAVIGSGYKRLKAMLPAHMAEERFAALIMAQAAKDTKIFQCTGESILNACYQAASLGLEINAAIGEAYLIPYRDRREGVMIATLVPGYKGLVKLAVQSPTVMSVNARLAYEGEVFDVSYGTQPQIIHKPDFDIPRLPELVRYAYAVAQIVKDGKNVGAEFEVMTRPQLNAVRDESLAKTRQQGPWVTHEEEMQRKTPTRRLCKYLPSTPQLADALELSDRAEIGEVRGPKQATARVVDLNAATEVALTPDCVKGCKVVDGALRHDPECKRYSDEDVA